jgi:hypothetical protein
MVNTAGNEDSRLCSFETSHRSSLPLNFAMSFIFLITTVIWLAKEVDETKCAKILLEVKKKKNVLTVRDHHKRAFFLLSGIIR